MKAVSPIMGKKKLAKHKARRLKKAEKEKAQLAKSRKDTRKGTLGKSRKRAVIKPADEPERALDFSYTQGREISWLRFDERVLDESLDETVPLFERLKFVSIFGSNLDEWFMVRIGSLSDLTRLKHQPRDNRSNETPAEQIDHALSVLSGLLKKQAAAFSGIEANLAGAGLTRVHGNDLTDTDLRAIAQYYKHHVAPIISPMIVDPRHPFPNLKNGRLYAICSLDGTDEEGLLGIVEVPHSLPRVVELPSAQHNWRYVLLEDVILSRLSECFGNYQPTSSAVVRVTRNADVDPDEGSDVDEDYRQHMKTVLKRRLRLQPVRLEIDRDLDEEVESFIAAAMNLESNHVFHTHMPLDLGYVFSLEDHIPAENRDRLLYDATEPQDSPMVDLSRPMREQVEDHDILLFYPYESMTPLLRLLREASVDETCISIKITLYRVAKQSRLCESLIAAVENGKEVTVLMELRARFDEANNIAWAERLESAGCTVIYGSEGFKCHSKICQITYHEHAHIRRLTCLGTGNFNEKTARLYSDFMLLTAHEGIGDDGNAFFRNLSLGNLYGSYQYLGVAPTSLKPLIMQGLDREIERAQAGQPAQVFMKMNSLTDRDVIDKLAQACQAGVTVVMIIRGITCIKANVPGHTEGLVIRQIVGRFLEHARVYAFGVDTDIVYLSSADMMTRNTEHRVEIAYPMLDHTCRSLVMQYMNLQLADTAKARELTCEGTWEKVFPEPGEPTINSQELLISLAKLRNETGGVDLSSLAPSTRIVPDLTLDQLRRVSSIPSTIVMGQPEINDSESVEESEAQEPSEAETETVDEAAAETIEDAETPDADEAAEEEPVAESEPATDAEAASETTEEPADEAAEVIETVDEAPAETVEELQEATEDEPVEDAPTTRQAPEPVEAHIIEEPEEDADDAPSTLDEEEPIAAIAKRTPGRFALGFKLILMGFKAIFTGRVTERRDQ